MNYTKTVTPEEAELPGVGKDYEKLFFLRVAKVSKSVSDKLAVAAKIC